VLTDDPKNNDKEQSNSYVVRWHDKFLSSASAKVLIYSALITFFASIQILVFTQTAERFSLSATYFAASIIVASSALILQWRTIKLQTLYLVLSQILLIGHLASLLIVTVNVDLIESKMIMAGIYTALGPTLIFVAPTSNILTILIALEHIIFGMIGWGFDHPNIENFNWFSLLSIFDALGLGLHIFLFNYLVKFSALDSRNKDLEIQNEKLRIQTLESQIQLAQKIQDSLSPAFNTLDWQNHQINFYQRRLEHLSGDWMGARVLSSGELILACADVTGKGIGAAMVAQAINTLWAESQVNSKFEPNSWLQHVNQILYRMGTKEPHTATLGLAVISTNDLSYYSCGHVPMFVRNIEPNSDQKFHPVSAGGNLLGLYKEIELIPTTLSFKENSSLIEVLLGSDGVFQKGNRTSSRQIESILQDFSKNKLGLNFENKFDDDRLLIWLRPVA